MISFRHHVVSLVAVLLALAAGVALGAGPLQRGDEPERPSVAASRPADALTAAAGDDFAAAAAPALLEGRLANAGVALVVMPGADPATVDALRTRAEEAGALVSGTYEVQEALLAPGQQALVDSLGTDLVEQYAPSVDPGSAPYARLGALLARAATSTDTAGQPVDAPATSVRDALAGAGLVTVGGEAPTRRPALALVVLGDDAARGAAAQRSADAVVGDLLAGLRSGAVGVVAAGTTASGDGGQLARLRRDGALAEVTTVDGAERVLGQVTAALALARARTGAAGSFGASGADGAVPLG